MLLVIVRQGMGNMVNDESLEQTKTYFTLENFIYY